MARASSGSESPTSIRRGDNIFDGKPKRRRHSKNCKHYRRRRSAEDLSRDRMEENRRSDKRRKKGHVCRHGIYWEKKHPSSSRRMDDDDYVPSKKKSSPDNPRKERDHRHSRSRKHRRERDIQRDQEDSSESESVQESEVRPEPARRRDSERDRRRQQKRKGHQERYRDREHRSRHTERSYEQGPSDELDDDYYEQPSHSPTRNSPIRRRSPIRQTPQEIRLRRNRRAMNMHPLPRMDLDRRAANMGYSLRGRDPYTSRSGNFRMSPGYRGLGTGRPRGLTGRPALFL